MELYVVETGNFKLDGGAMFGVVPKSLWQRTNPADNNNMVDLAMRSLLVVQDDRRILIDTGVGNKQDKKFFSYYHLWGEYSIDSSLKKIGLCRDDITDVFLTHLHFDHSGGAIQWNKNRTDYEPAFKNAYYWTNEAHWQWAMNSNDREKSSFLKENLLPIQESGQLKFIPVTKAQEWITTDLGFEVMCVDGHTEKQMIPRFEYKGISMVFTADLLPTVGHIPLPYVASYDVRPLLTLKEKYNFLLNSVKTNQYLFLEHDAHNQICTLKDTGKRIVLDKVYTFDEIFN